MLDRILQQRGMNRWNMRDPQPHLRTLAIHTNGKRTPPPMEDVKESPTRKCEITVPPAAAASTLMESRQSEHELYPSEWDNPMAPQNISRSTSCANQLYRASTSFRPMAAHAKFSKLQRHEVGADTQRQRHCETALDYLRAILQGDRRSMGDSSG